MSKEIGGSINTLAQFAMPKLTLEQEMRTLIGRHGSDKVRKEAIKQTKKKQGRKPERDWPLLKEIIISDAYDWLRGEDPFEKRSNYSIAKQFSKDHPGQDAQSTHRRIMSKLSKKRKWFTLVTAWQESEKNSPYRFYFRACDALAEHDPEMREIVVSLADSARGALERYREKIRTEANNILTGLTAPHKLNRGLFGGLPTIGNDDKK